MARCSGLTSITASALVTVFSSGQCHGKTTITGLPFGGSAINFCHGKTTITGSAIIPIYASGRCSGRTTITGLPRNQEPEEFTLNLIVDVVPPFDGNYPKLCIPRLKIDGIEIAIVPEQTSADESTRGIGWQVQTRIANMAQRSLIQFGSIAEFGFGKKIAGVWDEATFETLFTDGVIESKSRTVDGQPGLPSDQVTLTISSGMRNRIAQTPENDLYIYDPNVETMSLADFEEILPDSEGRTYPPELKPIADLSLHKLFQEIFVVRCGFTAFRTNIDDMPITGRIDCPMGKSFLESIGGQFGNFNPELIESNGELWIYDMTNLLPAGFPAPQAVTADDYTQLKVDASRIPVDALRVTYVENTRFFDYIDIRTSVILEENGTFGDPDYYTNLVQKSWRQYKRFSNPLLVLREDLFRETQESSGNDGVMADTREDYQYDQQGRMYRRDKTIKSRIADVENDGDYDVVDTGAEEEILRFATHPFQQKCQYTARREVSISGLILVDAANQQLGRDFEMEYEAAERRGNLQEGQTTRFGPIRTVIEKNTPKRDGSTEYEVLEIEHVSGKRIPHPKENRPGDIAQNAVAPRQNQVLVFDDENTTRSRDRVDDVHAGNMSLPQAIAWARRLLKARKLKPQTISTNVIAYRPGFGKGMSVAIDDRGETVGNFLIVGRSLQFQRIGLTMNLTGKEF